MKEDDIFGITVRNLQELFDECQRQVFPRGVQAPAHKSEQVHD